ncbi:hypothetical protein [Amycolatopsis sp. Hca4]|uniref:hypothetical protein n=1 Tax=Amycolatopsis sp. Hca4 TaxID=2742131 RepID=UPI001592688F|nr:hypothetical protein [Amycolatopsis sp. Hca4]QKV74482.1 hypothetical protein HUT10_12425 [Amycolatopsis sp. Hca4]
MDLEEAFTVVDTPVHLAGQSDDALLRQIRRRKEFSAPRSTLSPATGLEKDIHLRPLEALHWLSYVTRPRYQDDVLDRYLWWGLLRYLGFFTHDYSHSRLPELALSDAGRRIAGNQRRVTSEEMGIAFGAALAARWFGETGAATLRTVVDIDVALDARFVFGPSTAVEHIGTRRPDYLLIGGDQRDPGRCRLRVLECKGTKTPGNAVSQLARAVGQLDGVTVGSRVPRGLATSMVTGESRTSYLALNTEDDDEPSYEVDGDTIDRVGNFRFLSDRVDVTAAEITSASIRASWAMLADFGGNLPAIQRWAPEVMLDRIRRRPRVRETFETPVGPVRGTSLDFGFGRERLVVRYGVAVPVDDQLSGDSAGELLEAQQEFADRLEQSRGSERPPASREVYSATADGTVFSLVRGERG